MTIYKESPPCFILVRPQMGENIGATARAMANFGLYDLRIVSPRDGWPNQRADDMASGAFDGRVEVSVFDSLSGALHDVQYAYATTARNRDIVKPIFTPAEATTDRLKRKNVAFVFGPERTGLENDDIALCHALINIPTNPDFSSLNLGQSALLIAYALRQNIDVNITPDHDIAPLEAFDYFFQRFEGALDQSAFFKEPNLRPKVLRNIRSTLLRAEMTEQEIKMFHGILSAFLGDSNKA